MTQFNILRETYSCGFHNHTSLDPLKPIEHQLNRKRIQTRACRNQGPTSSLKQIIGRNSSLRIDFGWSFEGLSHYEKIMSECIEQVGSKYTFGTTSMVSDQRCSWLGFIPFNIFEKTVYEDLSDDSMIKFNNELVDFQIDVVNFITNHKIFLQHSITRNKSYRFELLKSRRHDRGLLEDSYLYYMQSSKEISQMNGVPRDLLEEHLGCHFLYHPDLFFELLTLSALKGEIYG